MNDERALNPKHWNGERGGLNFSFKLSKIVASHADALRAFLSHAWRALRASAWEATCYNLLKFLNELGGIRCFWSQGHDWEEEGLALRQHSYESMVARVSYCKLSVAWSTLLRQRIERVTEKLQFEYLFSVINMRVFVCDFSPSDCVMSGALYLVDMYILSRLKELSKLRAKEVLHTEKFALGKTGFSCIDS